MNMIEKVARGLYAKIDINDAELDPVGNWDNHKAGEDYREKYMLMAKAAILVMREMK